MTMTPLNRRFALWSAVAGIAAITAISGCAPREVPPPQARSAAPAQSLAEATFAKNPGDQAQRSVPDKSDALSDVSSHPQSGNVSVRSVTPEQFKQVIAAQKGKVVLVDFWATYCLPCRAKFPKTLALSKKYGDQGLAVVSMSMDSPEPKYQNEVIKFLRQQNSRITNLENGLDDTDAAFAALGIDGGALPHYKIFDRHGVLKKKFGGDPDHPFDEKDIEAAVIAALNAR